MTELATSMPLASTTSDQRREPHLAPIPTACPVPYCVVEHAADERTTAHLSGEVLLRRPADQHGSSILVRAELIRLDEDGEQGKTTLFLQGENPVELHTLAEVDAFIGDLAPLLTSLWRFRSQMELDELLTEHGARVVEMDADEVPAHLDGLLTGHYAQINGAPVLTFPRGQDVRERLTLARQLLARHAA